MQRLIPVGGYQRESKQVTHQSAGIPFCIKLRRKRLNFGDDFLMERAQDLRALG